MHQTEIFRGLSICSKLQQGMRSGKIDVLALMLKFVIEASRLQIFEFVYSESFVDRG
jgi:hypothetical protein